MTPAPLSSPGWNGWMLDPVRLMLCFPAEQFEIRIAVLWPPAKTLDLIFYVVEAPWSTPEIIAGLAHLLADLDPLALYTAPLNPVALKAALLDFAEAHEGGRV